MAKQEDQRFLQEDQQTKEAIMNDKDHVDLDDDDFNEAVEAYFAWCPEQGLIPTQPGKADSEYSETQDQVILRNSYGTIAVYNLVTKTIENLTTEELEAHDL